VSSSESRSDTELCFLQGGEVKEFCGMASQQNDPVKSSETSPTISGVTNRMDLLSNSLVKLLAPVGWDSLRFL
jgi:hypothetical protein